MLEKNIWLTVILGFIFFSIFLISIYDLISKKPEIELSEQGIGLRLHGWNHWDYVFSYWTTIERNYENDTNNEYLIIKLKDSRIIKCDISHLEISREQLIQTIKEFSDKIKYEGHIEN